MILVENWKLIFYLNTGRHQLFNLMDDPHELNDLSSSPVHRARLQRMR